MKKFNVGALRPATEDARSAQSSAAQDLVNRTLAQHGLLPGKEGTFKASPKPDLSGLEGLLSRF